jgi:hypothetical protein
MQYTNALDDDATKGMAHKDDWSVCLRTINTFPGKERDRLKIAYGSSGTLILEIV